MKVQEIYHFYTKSEELKTLKNKPGDQKKNIKQEIKDDGILYNQQSNFITQYMRWHFTLTDYSFLKSRIEKKTNFFFKRASVSRDGTMMARVDFDKNLTIYQIKENSKITELFTIYDIFVASRNIRFSHNSQKIAFLDINRKEINVWNIQKKQKEFVLNENPNFIIFSKIGDYIGIILDNALKIYKNDCLISETKEIKGGEYLDFANSKEKEDYVCIVVDQKIIVWNFKTKEILVKYEGEPEANLNSAVFFPNDSKILAASINQSVVIWDYNLELQKNQDPSNIDLEKKESVINLREHSGKVQTALISENQNYIFSYENKKTLPFAIIWKKNEKGIYEKLDTFNVDFTASSETLTNEKVIFLGYDSCIHIRDLKNKKDNFKSETQFGKRNFPSAYSPDHSLLGKISHNNIYLFETANGECSKKIETKITPLVLAFSPYSNQLAFVSKDEMFIYEIPKEKEKKIGSLMKSAKLSKPVQIIKYVNDKKLITGTKDGQLLVWSFEGIDLRSEALVRAQGSSIATVTISIHKDEIVCSGDAKGKFLFWNLRNLHKAGMSFDTKENLNDEITSCINAKFFNNEQKCLIGNSKSRFFVLGLPSEIGDQGQNPNEVAIDNKNLVEKFTIDAWPNEDRTKIGLSDFDLSSECQTLAVIYLDGNIALWNLKKREIMKTYQFFKYEESEMEKALIEIFFKPKKCNTIIIRAKESYKEVNIDPEVTERNNVPLIKAATQDRRIISIDKDEGIIKVINLETHDEPKNFYAKEKQEKQELRSCFLSIDFKNIFAFNLEKYFICALDSKETDLETKAFEFKLKKDLVVAYQKAKKECAYVADPTKGVIYSWGKDRNVFGNMLSFVGDFTLALQNITSFDISHDDSKMLIESDNNQILVFEIQKGKTWKKTETKFANLNHNTIFLSKFSAHTDNIYNVMIENYEHRILEWNIIDGKIKRSIPCYSTIQKIIIEPKNDNLFIFSSKEKKSTLELFSFTNEVFIQLSDADDEQPENFFYMPETTELIISYPNNKIKIFHDFYNNSYFIMEKKKKLSKIFEIETAVEENLGPISKNQSFNFKNNEKNITAKISPYTRMFPFNYNFLQIMAYDEDYHSLEGHIFELLKNEKRCTEQISFDLFFQRDIHGRNCFDIAFAGKDTKLFKDFLIFIKSKFKISDIQNSYRDYLDSKFFLKMFLMFEDNSIMSEFLNFVFDDPLEFPSGKMSKRMKEPILIKTKEPNLPKLTLDEELKKHQEEEKVLFNIKENDIDVELDEQVMAKCLYPCEFLDYKNEATMEIFKKVGEFEPINQIFESKAIVKLLDYKWHTYARKEYFYEGLMFLLFLVIYIVNVDFFFISRMGTEIDNDDSSGHLIFSISSGVIDCIIFIFVFRLIFHEYKQLRYFGFKDYFNSFWNYNDILYIVFSLMSTAVDLCSCFDLFHDFDILKAMHSLTIFFAFFRLMSYARGIEGSSFMIKLIIRVVSDIVYFLFLMILFIVSLACSG